MFEKPDFPERITIELTNHCNLNCDFCPRHHSEMDLGYMPAELFRKITDEAAQHLPVCLVMFLRGESLLHPELVDFIKTIKQKGFAPVQLASNGLLLDDAMGEKLIASGLDFISFSLDTNNDELYKKSRKNGDLAVSRQNVINFSQKCAEKRKQGIKTPEIQVSTVDIEEYRAEQEEFIRFWLQYADRVRVYAEHSSDGSFGSISRELLKPGKDERKPCKKVYSDIIIYWDGKTALCNHDWDNRLRLGNVNEQSIQEIWNSQEYEKVRRMHETACFSDDIVCKNCDHWQVYYTQEQFLGRLYTPETAGL